MLFKNLLADDRSIYAVNLQGDPAWYRDQLQLGVGRYRTARPGPSRTWSPRPPRMRPRWLPRPAAGAGPDKTHHVPSP